MSMLSKIFSSSGSNSSQYTIKTTTSGTAVPSSPIVGTGLEMIELNRGPFFCEHCRYMPPQSSKCDQCRNSKITPTPTCELNYQGAFGTYRPLTRDEEALFDQLIQLHKEVDDLSEQDQRFLAIKIRQRVVHYTDGLEIQKKHELSIEEFKRLQESIKPVTPVGPQSPYWQVTYQGNSAQSQGNPQYMSNIMTWGKT